MVLVKEKNNFYILSVGIQISVTSWAKQFAMSKKLLMGFV